MKIVRQVEQVYICVQGRNCIEYFSATNIVFKRLSDLLPSTVFTVKLFMLIMNMHNHEGGDVLTDWESTEQCITMQLQQKQQSSSLLHFPTVQSITAPVEAELTLILLPSMADHWNTSSCPREEH